MNVGSVGGFKTLAAEMQTAKAATHSTSSSSVLKDAMNEPKQFMQLLEQSIAVNNAERIASNMGVMIDTKV